MSTRKLYILTDSRKVGAKLRQLRMARNLTQKDLAAVSGINQSELSGIESGARTLGIKRLEKLAAVLGVSPAEFLAMDDEVTGPSPMPPSRRILPIRGYVTAGTGLVIEEDNLGDMAVLEFEGHPYRHDAYILDVRGDSMAPAIPNRARVVVEPLADNKKRPLDRIVVARNRAGEMTIKAVGRIGKQWFLKPLNLAYRDIPLTEEWRIVGVVRTIMNPSD